MDVEEPEAALDIPVAFHKKNEAATKIGHCEILAALTNLCNPDPTTGSVEYIPVRDRLIDLYGAAVDHPDFYFCVSLYLVVRWSKQCASRGFDQVHDPLREPASPKDELGGVCNSC